MKKHIEWSVVQGNGEVLFDLHTRWEARKEKKWLSENMFEPGMEFVVFPIKIVRREWSLVDEREVH